MLTCRNLVFFSICYMALEGCGGRFSIAVQRLVSLRKATLSISFQAVRFQRGRQQNRPWAGLQLFTDKSCIRAELYRRTGTGFQIHLQGLLKCKNLQKARESLFPFEISAAELAEFDTIPDLNVVLDVKSLQKKGMQSCHWKCIHFYMQGNQCVQQVLQAR